ncbi:MAG: glycosyltransferase family 2 protein [Bacteroidetes bacterium]|nr:glycosyltransferase family 2 protein [Bacteroidota bacterium]
MDVSLVIPAYNEEESLTELMAWISKVMKSASLSYEALLIDDGSNDNTWEKIEELSNDYPIKGFKFQHNYGKSAALFVGFENALGDSVITMDADMQDSPDEIPELHRMIVEEGFDMVSGWKRRRYDPMGKTIPSRFFNYTARIVSGIKLHDFNCGLKAYRNDVVKSIEVYGEMHRYIPVLVKASGFKKIGEKIVHHRARKYGVSKYGIERMMKGYLDLLTVTFLTRFSKSPMYFFGAFGTLLFLMGGFSVAYIIIEKLCLQSAGQMVRAVTAQPLFFLAILAIILGVQFFMTGLLAELMSRKAPERNSYKIIKNI